MLNHTKKIKEIYEVIQKMIFYMIPEKWDKLYLYSSVIDMPEDNQIDRELYRDTIDKFDSKLDKFAIALENNNNELGAIKEDIRNIKERVGV